MALHLQSQRARDSHKTLAAFMKPKAIEDELAAIGEEARLLEGQRADASAVAGSTHRPILLFGAGP